MPYLHSNTEKHISDYYKSKSDSIGSQQKPDCNRHVNKAILDANNSLSPSTSLFRPLTGYFGMESDNLLRRRIISSLMDHQCIDEVANASIILWELMASQIILIVGEGGFSSLYARSLFLSRSTFPWLPTGSTPDQSNKRFAELKLSLERQHPLQANKANCLLLITFTDILASLIGEQLTLRILRSAWGNDVLDEIGEESNDE